MVIFCEKCGETWWIIFSYRILRIHSISYISFPEKSMRWVFVRNAVNFAVNFWKKCGEMRWKISFTTFTAINGFVSRVHRIHRISYKNLPIKPPITNILPVTKITNIYQYAVKKYFSQLISCIFLRWMRWVTVNYLFSSRSQYFYKKESALHGLGPLNSYMPSTPYSAAPTVTYF